MSLKEKRETRMNVRLSGDFRNKMTQINAHDLSNYSLAQQNSILQALHEAVPDPFAGHILYPQPQLLFLLRVILACKLTEV